MPLEDHQGELKSASPMNTNSLTKTSQKSTMGDKERRACNYLHHLLLDRIIQRKAECKGEVLLNGPKIMSPHR
jgi:hypothetical protein